MSWISIKDRLPEDKQDVLLSDWFDGVNYGMVKGYYLCKTWFIDHDSVNVCGNASIDIGFKPTHWQPLPEPPKGE